MREGELEMKAESAAASASGVSTADDSTIGFSGAGSVCFLVPGLGSMGGSVRVAVQLANRLSERFSVSIVSCAPFDEPAFSVDNDIALRSLGIEGGRIRERVRAARKPLSSLLREMRPRVLFGIGTYETLMAIVPCRNEHVKLVFCDHGALMNQWSDKQMRAVRFLDSHLSARTVTLTRRSLEDYHKRLCVPRRKLSCIPNWIPCELAGREHVYHTDSKKIIWAGRLDKEKGVDHLLDIAERVLPAHPDWTWDVYGERVMDDDGIDVDGRIVRSGLSGKLRLMGRVDNLYDLYGEYAIGTLTSYREGLPLTLLEGKACGLPLISFDVTTGPSEIIEDGVDGYLVQPYDCEAYANLLEKMMNDGGLREEMSLHALRSVRAFDEEAIYGRWVKLIEELGA